MHSTNGFSAAVDEQLVLVARVSELQEYEKSVCLFMDEVYIKEDFVYKKHSVSGEIIGFANFGDINTHLLELQVEGKKSTQKLAKTMFVFMVRGLFIKLQFLYAQFPCTTTMSGDLLYDLVWKQFFDWKEYSSRC